MERKVVVANKHLPSRVRWFETAVIYLFLDRVGGNWPGSLHGAIWTIWVLVFIGEAVMSFRQRERAPKWEE